MLDAGREVAHDGAFLEDLVAMRDGLLWAREVYEDRVDGLLGDSLVGALILSIEQEAISQHVSVGDCDVVVESEPFEVYLRFADSILIELECEEVAGGYYSLRE